MNKGFTTIAVLGLLLIGLAVCLKQTLDFYDDLEPSSSSSLLAAEGLLAVVIFGSALLLLRRRFSQRNGSTRARHLAAFAHVRRLLAGVWS